MNKRLCDICKNRKFIKVLSYTGKCDNRNFSIDEFSEQFTCHDCDNSKPITKNNP